MPTFDGGHYFLTVLAPVRTGLVADGVAVTSPVHALRKLLALLPPAVETPACAGAQSPFARNRRNHFARFAVIDDVAYNGRLQPDALRAALQGLNPLVAQPQDHLGCPFLLFAADIDAASGADSERDVYLVELWETMGEQLRGIFGCCEGFDAEAADAASFARYIGRCQIETTMPFNDYYVDPLNLPTWPVRGYLVAAGIAAAAAVGGLLGALAFGGGLWPALALLGAASLAFVVWRACSSVMAAGARPFPAAPDSTLPAVLKALYLQRALTRFAIDNQTLAAAKDAASTKSLHDAFAGFIAAHQPANLNEPTQPPGVVAR